MVPFVFVISALVGSALALTTQDRQAILAQYAPLVYFHPKERWMPADPASHFSKSQIVHGALDVPDNLKAGNIVDSSGNVHAPVSAQIVQNGPFGKTHLQYWFYHGFNGNQGFQIGTFSGFFKKTKANFEWAPIANHNSDWEHITVQLDGVYQGGNVSNAPQISQIAYAQHSDAAWVSRSSISFSGTHPIVYSGLNSHASYPDYGTHFNTNPTFDNFVSAIAPFITLASVRWIHIADIHESEDPVYTYQNPPVTVSTPEVSWSTWQSTIYDISNDNTPLPAWATFDGYWGQPLDQTQFQKPPDGVPSQTVLYDGLKAAYDIGSLKSFVNQNTTGEPGPRQHGSWTDLDSPPN